MKRIARILASFLLLAVAPTSADGAATVPADAGPAVGQVAPDDHLQDQKGDWHTLADEHGKWTVLYFYRKDFTPGCITEVCTFRDDIIALRKAGAEAFGVSLDDVKSHAGFAEKYQVPFCLLSDADPSVAKNYGVLRSRLGMSYARRETFLIDPQGKVTKHYKDVDPKENSKQVLAELASLR